MSLAQPLGLLALAAWLPLVLIYFLRRRVSPREVSGLFLWRSVRPRAEAGPRLRRFSRELSLLLQALAVGAGALFLAGLRCGAEAAFEHWVVVLDGTMSMSARAGEDGTTAQRAAREVARRLEERGGGVRVTLVQSGHRPRLLAGPGVRVADALEVLSAWSPRGPSHDPGPSWSFARELGGPGARVLFVTDRLPEEEAAPADDMEWLALGRALPNLALVEATREDEGGNTRVMARVANLAETPIEAEVSARATARQAGGEEVASSQRLALGPSEVGRVSFVFARVDEVELRLPEDALPEDGRVLLPPPAPPVRVHLLPGLSVTERLALERVLSLLERAVRVEEEGELTFGPLDSGADVRLGAAGERRTLLGPFVTARRTALLEDVRLAGVSWTVGTEWQGTPLLLAGGLPLILEDAGGGLMLNLDLARSGVARSPDWPVLISNLVERARSGRPGFSRRHVVLGEPVQVVLGPGAPHRLRGPEGERSLVGHGPLELAGLEVPGSYRLLRDGRQVDRLEVLATDRAASDLRGRSSGSRSGRAARGEQPQPGQQQTPRARWPLGAFLVLALGSFALTGRRR